MLIGWRWGGRCMGGLCRVGILGASCIVLLLITAVVWDM